MSDKARKALLVLGMHRSGTSLLTGLIANAGVSIGRTVMAPAEDNPRGFFENQRIVDFNERAMNALDLGWASWESLPENWLSSLPASLLEEAGKILDDEFGDVGLICIKDPRICRLLPFWFQVLSSRDFEAFCVLTTRSLDEVSASLQTRDGMGRAQAEALWLRYNLDAMNAASGAPGFHVSYDEVLAEPGAALTRVSNLLGEELEFADQSFADSGLRHHQATGGSTWAELVMTQCENFPYPPDTLLENVVYPLVARLAKQEKQFGEILASEVSTSELSTREGALFNQAEEAKQHAISLARELETGRNYIVDLEREHQEKDQLIQAQEASLQEAKAQFESSMADSEAYAESLRASIEEMRTYNDSLSTTLEQKDHEIEQYLQELESLRSELERKESELSSAHENLIKMNAELEQTHQRLIDRTRELEEELQKFKLQRRMIEMFKRDSDG